MRGEQMRQAFKSAIQGRPLKGVTGKIYRSLRKMEKRQPRRRVRR